MKKTSILFLKTVIVLVGIGVMALLIRLPLIEGRATNLDLVSIYLDPFILYVYAASVAFFVVLFQAFKLLGYMGQNNIFSTMAVTALRTIKRSAILLAVLIVFAVLYILLFHAKDDYPTGFITLGAIATSISLIVAAAANLLEKTCSQALSNAKN